MKALSVLRRLMPLACAAVLLAAAGGCKNRKSGNLSGSLRAPKDAKAFAENYAVAFDDGYTPVNLRLVGRAPSDVVDQRLFQARLGHADIVTLVRIDHVWAKGLYEGDKNQYLDVELGMPPLLGAFDRKVDPLQLVQVRSADPLPAELEGQVMLLFLKWAPGEEPTYRHHLLPAQPETVNLIKAMVAHAEAEGVLSPGGGRERSKSRRLRRRAKRKAEREERRAGREDETASAD